MNIFEYFYISNTFHRTRYVISAKTLPRRLISKQIDISFRSSSLRIAVRSSAITGNNLTLWKRDINKMICDLTVETITNVPCMEWLLPARHPFETTCIKHFPFGVTGLAIGCALLGSYGPHMPAISHTSCYPQSTTPI